MPTGQVPTSQYEALRADRDRLAAEVERLKSDVATWADLALDNLKLYDQRSDEVTTLRAERDAAIASRDSAVNDTAEAIARWLDEQSGTSKLTVTERYLIGRLAEKVRTGAWRGQNGGE